MFIFTVAQRGDLIDIHETVKIVRERNLFPMVGVVKTKEHRLGEKLEGLRQYFPPEGGWNLEQTT